MTDIKPETKLIEAEAFIVCPNCQAVASRVGTQDYVDVYLCKFNHITRIKVGAPRKAWEDKG